jgi:hypothetical protein
MSLRNRLRRLETGESEARACPECGGPWRPGDPVELVVSLGDEKAPEPIPTEPPCPECGREMEVVIDWDDAPSPEELRRLEAAMLERGALQNKEEGSQVPDFPPSAWGGGGTT